MSSSKEPRFLTLCCAGLLLIGGCGGGSSDQNSGDKYDDQNQGTDQNPNDAQNQGGQGRPLAFSINLVNAANLAITEPSSAASTSAASRPLVRGLVLQSEALQSSTGTEDSTNVAKIDQQGVVSDALVDARPEGTENMTVEQLNQMGSPPPRPRVVALGIAPTGEVYVLFEHPFLYRVVDDPTVDPWSAGSPYRCQLFRATLSLDEALAGESVAPDAPTNLECLTADFEVPTWRQGLVMQFDALGNMYFPAHVSGTDQDLFYSYNPNTKALTEVVNANICWRNVEVTPTGSVFYTGTTKVDSDCSGTSFFRYISRSNRLLEISRGWWEYAFTSEVDPGNPEGERILFYGPDPDTANGLPSWDSACLYRYDPGISDPTQRSTRLTKCLNDVWSWVDLRDISGANEPRPSLPIRLLRKERCEADGQVFIGGSGISRLEQGGNGEVYLLGQMQRKRGGQFKCNLEIHSPHCSSLEPTDDETGCANAGLQWINEGWCDGGYYPTAEECQTATHTWWSNSKWYDNATGAACITSGEDNVTAEQAAAGVVYKPGWQVQNVNCQPPAENSGQWTQAVRGVAHLDPNVADPSENLPELMSTLDEDAINFWLLEREGETFVYYSSFKTGRYLFTEARLVAGATGLTVERRVLLEEYEVYNVSASPNHPTRLMFDSLYFPTNTYRFGSIDVGLAAAADVAASFEVTDGLTGRIRTLIIVPQF